MRIYVVPLIVLVAVMFVALLIGPPAWLLFIATLVGLGLLLLTLAQARREKPVTETKARYVGEAPEIRALRLDVLNKLDASMIAAEAAQKAVDRGAPLDGAEITAAREAIHEANEAISRWREAGGIEELHRSPGFRP